MNACRVNDDHVQIPWRIDTRVVSKTKSGEGNNIQLSPGRQRAVCLPSLSMSATPGIHLVAVSDGLELMSVVEESKRGVEALPKFT